MANNSGENEWYTPETYIDAARKAMGSIDLDPASSAIANATVKATTFYTADDDGLTKQWAGNTWLNPPYAQPLIAQFAEKLVDSLGSQAVKSAIVLVNNATETRWFQTLLTHCSAMCLVRGRIKFLDPLGNPNGAPLQGQTFLYFGPDPQSFSKEFSQWGSVR